MDRIGTDESGKGDFFGPLVVAAVYVERGGERLLRQIGVRDCKRLKDYRVLALEKEIKEGFEHDVVKVNPERYNKLYAKFGNLNMLLGWAHARAIENMLAKVKCERVVSDKFGDESFLKDKLMSEGKKVDLRQRHRAESDLAVASASILARGAYLRQLYSMRKRYGMVFPKGAVDVLDAGVSFAKMYGAQRLNEVAKTHFKTTDSIMQKLKRL